MPSHARVHICYFDLLHNQSRCHIIWVFSLDSHQLEAYFLHNGSNFHSHNYAVSSYRWRTYYCDNNTLSRCMQSFTDSQPLWSSVWSLIRHLTRPRHIFYLHIFYNLLTRLSSHSDCVSSFLDEKGITICYVSDSICFEESHEYDCAFSATCYSDCITKLTNC